MTAARARQVVLAAGPQGKPQLTDFRVEETAIPTPSAGSGMGAVAAVLDLLPVGARVVAPTDCYAGVHALLADGQQQGRWQVDLVDVTDTSVATVAARRGGSGVAGIAHQPAARHRRPARVVRGSTRRWRIGRGR